MPGLSSSLWNPKIGKDLFKDFVARQYVNPAKAHTHARGYDSGLIHLAERP